MRRPGPRTTISSLRTTKDQDQGNIPAINIYNKVWVYRIWRWYDCACFTVVFYRNVHARNLQRLCITSWFTVLNNFIRNWVTAKSQDLKVRFEQKETLRTIRYNRHTFTLTSSSNILLQTPLFQLCQKWNGKNLWNIWSIAQLWYYTEITNFFAPEKKMCRPIVRFTVTVFDMIDEW